MFAKLLLKKLDYKRLISSGGTACAPYLTTIDFFMVKDKLLSTTKDNMKDRISQEEITEEMLMFKKRS